VNYTKGSLTKIRSKWLNKQKRWSEVSKRKPLDGEIKEGGLWTTQQVKKSTGRFFG
jgi:hypothetical protein